MFTGIVTDVGEVLALSPLQSGVRVRIATAYDPASIAIGASIACAGPCLTAVATGSAGNRGWFEVEASTETLARTTLGGWRPGSRVNLERALRVGDELGGHIVTGHIDGVGEVEGVLDVGGSKRLTLIADDGVAAYLAPKGSVSLDGVSLTVNEVENLSEGVRFSLNIIPHTADQTTFADVTPGRKVNIEIDLFARYIGRLLELRR